MADRLAHRGPDASGSWADPAAGIALGFRRLSIIDLSSAGAQPMVSASGRSVLAYNGEVYNPEELRPELERRGIRWRGHSDSEVILEAFEAWGVTATAKRLIGMFALAWWDSRTRTLWLLRDRIGKKPLYYGCFNGTVLFGSELKALMAHPACRAHYRSRRAGRLFAIWLLLVGALGFSGHSPTQAWHRGRDPGRWLSFRRAGRTCLLGRLRNRCSIAVSGERPRPERCARRLTKRRGTTSNDRRCPAWRVSFGWH